MTRPSLPLLSSRVLVNFFANSYVLSLHVPDDERSQDVYDTWHPVRTDEVYALGKWNIEQPCPRLHSRSFSLIIQCPLDFDSALAPVSPVLVGSESFLSLGYDPRGHRAATPVHSSESYLFAGGLILAINFRDHTPLGFIPRRCF